MISNCDFSNLKARTMNRYSALGLGLALLTGIIYGCGPTVFISVRTLEVVPNVAVTGDTVKFVPFLDVAPSQQFYIVAFINGTEHISVTETGEIHGNYSLTVGLTEELIATYGTGTHLARVEVRLPEFGRTVGSQDVSFSISP